MLKKTKVIRCTTKYVVYQNVKKPKRDVCTTKYDTTYPILYRSRRQKERELKRNYNQISLLNQTLVKGEIDHKVQLLGSAKT